MKNRFMYEAEFEKENTGYSVVFPQLPDAFTQGETLEESVDRAAEVLQLILAEYLDEGRKLPKPEYKGYSQNVFRVAVSVEVTPEFIECSKCVTAVEAANELGVTKGRVTQMLDTGILQAVPFGNERLVTIASINARKAHPRGAGRPKKST